jgi:hypothetical protein
MLRHAAILQFESSATPPKILDALAARSLLGHELCETISAVDEAIHDLYQTQGSDGFERAILTNSAPWCAVRSAAAAALRALHAQRSGEKLDRS